MNKYNLSDFTFLFPVRIDSMDRYQNLNLVINFIKHFFETYIIVLEVDDFQHIDEGILPNGIDYYFIKDSRSRFHRTHYINELIKKAITPFVGIWDADVIIPVSQLVGAIQLLRNYTSFCIFPYDGQCYSLGPKEKCLLEKNMYLETKAGVLYAEHACGGALMVNRLAFIRAGMCNEYLTSWGPDDVEQKKRLEILGYPLSVIEGPLFHLFHARCNNSGYQNNVERIKLMEEYIRIASMTKKELQEDIKSWPWLFNVTDKKESKIEIPEKELYHFLNSAESDTALKSISRMMGWLYLALRNDNPEYQEKIGNLQQIYLEEINKVDSLSAETLSDTGLALLIALKTQLLPVQNKIYLNQIEVSLFNILYRKRLHSLNFDNGIWKIILYFRELLASPEEYRTFHPVYYKEYLIYAIDEVYRILNGQSKKESLTDFFATTNNKIDFTLGLWVCHMISDMGVNQVMVEKIKNKMSGYIRQYFTGTSKYEVADIWLLYIWNKVQSDVPENVLYFFQWFARWKQNSEWDKLTIPENYLYQECCRICNEPALNHVCTEGFDLAIRIFTLQNILS